MTRDQLARAILKRSLLKGEFVLRSGATSDRYFDKYLQEMQSSKQKSTAKNVDIRNPDNFLPLLNFLYGYAILDTQDTYQNISLQVLSYDLLNFTSWEYSRQRFIGYQVLHRNCPAGLAYNAADGRCYEKCPLVNQTIQSSTGTCVFCDSSCSSGCNDRG